MSEAAVNSDFDARDASTCDGGGMEVPAIDTEHLGLSLRSHYEHSVDREPIPDMQIDLILRLRSKERDLRAQSRPN